MHLLLGIGNDLLGDDGVGPYVANHLQNSDWITIDAGIMPENFLRPVRNHNPDTIVIVDAMDMGLKPGSIRIIPPDFIRDCGIGTHQLPLTFVADQFLSICTSVTFIGIQPGSLDPDTYLSDPILKAAEFLVNVLNTYSFDQLKVFGQEGRREQD